MFLSLHYTTIIKQLSEEWENVNTFIRKEYFSSPTVLSNPFPVEKIKFEWLPNDLSLANTSDYHSKIVLKGLC